MPSKSKKQARLMAAVAHNPKFAKKVGISQSVGREFNDADRKLRKYAEGGKVKTFKRMSELLKDPMSHSMWSEDSPRYRETLKYYGWDPEMDPDDFNFMAGYVEGNLWHWGPDSPHLKRMDELIKKYGLRPYDTTTWRGLEVPPDVVSTWKPGDILRNKLPSSVSVERNVADGFANLGAQEGERVPTLIRIAPSDRLSLPVPQSGQSELVMPSGDAGRLGLNKIRYNPRTDTYEIEAETVPHPGFAEGGRVLPSSTENEESWSDTYLKRPLSGLASMWGATDPETGEFVNPAWHNIKRVLRADSRRRAGLPREEMATPGILDEALSLPALGEIVGLPAPGFAKDAEERASTTREAARDSLGLDAPHGFTENLTESAGVMAGQLPVPGTIANRLKVLKNRSLLGKIAGPAVEWFSPSVVPKAKNYAQGTLFGGGLGGTLDYLEDHLNEKEQEERNRQFISEAMAEVLAEEQAKLGTEEDDDAALAELGYAEGGRVKQAKRVIGNLRSMLSDTDADDVSTRKAAIDQAIAALKGTAGPSEMDRVQLHTLSTGLSDAAATPIPERRRQRFGDYEQNILNLLERRVAPVLTDPTVPQNLPVVSNMAPLPTVPKLDPNLPHVRLDRELGPMRAEQMLRPADNRQGVLTQEEWEKMLNIKKQFASGGKVTGYNPWDSPQSQKEAFTTSPAPGSGTPGRQGAPLSPEWYETYGEGPEHLFMGERNIPDLKGWTPQHQGMPQVPQSGGKSGSSTLSNLTGLASLGLIGYDIYKDIRGNDITSSLDPSILDGAGDTSATNQWIQNDFDNMEMPTAEFDPSVWDRTKQGAGGALDIYMGAQQGGIGGAGSMLSGSSDLYGAFGGKEAFGGIAGNVGGILQGIGDGTVKGYLKAGGDAMQLAKAMGYSGPIFDSAGKLLPVVGQLFSAYDGIKRGDPAGYLQAAGSLYGAASTAGLTSSTGALASSGLGAAAGLGALGFVVADVANQALGTGADIPKWNAVEDAGVWDRIGAEIRPYGRAMQVLKLPTGQQLKYGVAGSISEALMKAYLEGNVAKANHILANIPKNYSMSKDHKNHYRSVWESYG